MVINLNYIRAAIYGRTGIYLKLKEVAQYLVEEGFINQRQAERCLHFSYDSLHQDGPSKTLDNPKPIDQLVNNWEVTDMSEDEEED